ncbi:MAG: tape measure protein [Hespellia sp.]|nr:tape measure protein [Hespellia sp.]
MAESYSVKAVLSAQDSGFSSVMKGASSSLSNLKSTITSGLGFGILMGVGQQAFSAITSSMTSMFSEMSENKAAWSTFQGNMQMIGNSKSEITSIKKELQDFSNKSIYNAADMASAYSQLEAVGTKNTTALVKGFGGLAAAASDPKQAMKTLSTQATQMAAKPTVAWMDFKLMMEQTPAGVAAVAKQMGMSAQEMVGKIQDGTVATEDFFDAVAKVGTNDSFTKLATTYKTSEQAFDGLMESIQVKGEQAFNKLDSVGISAINNIISSLDKVNVDSITGNIMNMVNTVEPYWSSFSGAVGSAASACGEAFSAIGSSLGEVLSKQSTIDSFTGAVDAIAGAVEWVAGVIADNSDTIVAALPYVAGLALAFKGFQVVKTVAPFVGEFTGAIGQLASKGLGSLAAKLFGTAAAEEATGVASASSAGQVLAAAAAFLALGAGVVMIATGFYILSSAAANIADAGPVAIGVLVGMVAAVVGLAAGAAVLGPALSAGAIGFAAFGAAVLLAGAGMLLLSTASINLAAAGAPAIACMVGMVAAIALLAVGAAVLGPALIVGGAGLILFGAGLILVATAAVIAGAALNIIALALPAVVQYGASGAVAMIQLGAGLAILGSGALVAGAGCIVLGAGLAVVAVGLALVGAAVLITATGIMVLAAGALLLGTGLLVAGAAVTILSAALPATASGAMAAGSGLTMMLGVSV